MHRPQLNGTHVDLYIQKYDTYVDLHTLKHGFMIHNI